MKKIILTIEECLKDQKEETISFLKKLGSDLHALKIKMGNKTEKIIFDIFQKNLEDKKSKIKVSHHVKIELSGNNFSKKNSYIDILLEDDENKTRSYIEIKDGGINHTYSEDQKAKEILHRVKCSNCNELLILVTKKEHKEHYLKIINIIRNINKKENSEFFIENLIANVNHLNDQEIKERFNDLYTPFVKSYEENYNEIITQLLKENNEKNI
jgi:hypothetical protein